MEEAVLMQQKALILHFQQDFQEIRDMLDELELEDGDNEANEAVKDRLVNKADNMITLIDQILAL